MNGNQPRNPNTRFFNIRNKNNDINNQEIYRQGGKVLRDNTVGLRGRSSLQLASWYAGYPITHAASAPVAGNGSVQLLGFARFNSVYGLATPPSLTISGMGITPVVWTCPSVADTWHSIDITVANSRDYPGEFALNFWAMSAANTETACAWFDGIAMTDFVDWTRHYGFTYDPANPARTVNPITLLSESAAAALTGIAYSAGTLTISQPHTMREVYDWMQQYECANRLAPILTSSDGVSYALAANLVLSAALTGSGSIAMPTGTLTNTGSSTLSITHNAGVLTTISASGITAGSRVQIYDVTSSTELYNGVPGTSLVLNANWSTNHTIRLRCGYAVGTSAMMPIETNGILSSTGASFLVNQVADAVYNAMAIDGSTCTEFTADYPNLLMDVTDPDGITSVQRLYAWAAWQQTSANGIESMFSAVTASDSSNFTIQTAVVNAKLKNLNSAPVIITGGYLARSDGATVIAATSGSIQMDPSKAYVASGIASQVADIAAIHGLVAGSPMTVTPTSRSAGGIVQTITGDGATTSTVTRV